jgi:hypothetical protein
MFVDSKFEFDGLLSDVKIKIAQNLPTPSLRDLAFISKSHWTLFKPMLDVREFLHYVVCGKYDESQEMLDKDVTLALKKGMVIDNSNRIFLSISALEYAFWALDKDLWTRLVNCFLQQDKEIPKELSIQYQNVKKYGISYTFGEKTITEVHFDFENTIIKALETQAKLVYKSFGKMDCEQANEQWVKSVGGSQKLFPMYLVYKYCEKSNESLSQEFYNLVSEKYESWFESDSKLGIDFAIYRDNADEGAKGSNVGGWVMQDLHFVKKLYEERTKAFINFESYLIEQIISDNLVKRNRAN